MDTIRNPIEWSGDALRHTAHHLEAVGRSLGGSHADARAAHPAVRRIALRDLVDVLRKGLEDFGANRTDVVFVCLIYPVMGIVLSRFAFGNDMLPLLFPLASGFALVGPVAAVGLYEMSRRREQGMSASWAEAFGVVRAPAFGAILVLGLALVMIFGFWLMAAQAIYAATLGPQPPESVATFARDVLTTAAGWQMIGIGIGVGFLFALAVLAISVVSFPMLLDRDAGLGAAVATSVRAVWSNPVPMAGWGLIVAGGLVIGSLPLFIGLIIILPVLGHATWHLYRRVIE